MYGCAGVVDQVVLLVVVVLRLVVLPQVEEGCEDVRARVAV